MQYDYYIVTIQIMLLISLIGLYIHIYNMDMKLSLMKIIEFPPIPPTAPTPTAN